MWIWNTRRRRADIVSQGECSFSSAVPLGFAETQGAGRVGSAGTEGPWSRGCVSLSWVSLNKWPSAAQCLSLPIMGAQTSTTNVSGHTARVPWSKGQSIMTTQERGSLCPHRAVAQRLDQGWPGEADVAWGCSSL